MLAFFYSSYKLDILGLSEVKRWDPREYSSPSWGNMFMSSGKPSGGRSDCDVGRFLKATAKCRF